MPNTKRYAKLSRSQSLARSVRSRWQDSNLTQNRKHVLDHLKVKWQLNKKMRLIPNNHNCLLFSITNLQAFKCLKTLSLGRNNLKTLQGIEASSETLEQLWISYNQVRSSYFFQVESVKGMFVNVDVGERERESWTNERERQCVCKWRERVCLCVSVCAWGERFNFSNCFPDWSVETSSKYDTSKSAVHGSQLRQRVERIWTSLRTSQSGGSGKEVF